MSPSSVMSVAAVPYRPVTHVPLGIGYMLMAVALFGGMDAAVKWLGGSYPTLQIMFFRRVFAILPTLLMVHRRAVVFRALRPRPPPAPASMPLLRPGPPFGFFPAFSIPPP